MSDDREGRIRERAYRLWQDEGEPHGKHDDHWQRAESEVAGEQPAATGATAKSKSTRGNGAAAPLADEPADSPATTIASGSPKAGAAKPRGRTAKAKGDVAASSANAKPGAAPASSGVTDAKASAPDAKAAGAGTKAATAAPGAADAKPATADTKASAATAAPKKPGPRTKRA
jgi:hypothetical protein